MEVKELRIGNRIDFKVDSLKEIYTNGVITEISEKYVHINGVRIPNSALVPIKLTEKHLIKFGGKENYERYFIGLLCIHYDWDENGNKWFYYCPDTLPNIKIKYVHQLQNLYFALTGEELTNK